MSTNMPDVAHHASAQTEGILDQVGMSNIELPLMVRVSNESERQVSASVEAFVNLKVPTAKGIHMSRLYLLLDNLSNTGVLDRASLATLLDNFITSHEELSDQAYVKFSFDYQLRRRSLISGKQGWKSYPVTLIGRLQAGLLSTELKVDVPYSSTCPCSAALARQLIQQAFQDRFDATEALNREEVHAWLGTTEGIVATPHSQRSVAEITVKLSKDLREIPLVELIDTVEDALQTPVQAAVKRADEQEFARLNGQNLMFCEDAARRLKHALNMQSGIQDFWLRVNHLESLHAHDAVAVTCKGIENGYQI